MWQTSRRLLNVAGRHRCAQYVHFLPVMRVRKFRCILAQENIPLAIFARP